MKRNMDRRTFLKMAGSAVLVGVLAGCGDAGGGAPGNGGNPGGGSGSGSGENPGSSGSSGGSGDTGSKKWGYYTAAKPDAQGVYWTYLYNGSGSEAELTGYNCSKGAKPMGSVTLPSVLDGLRITKVQKYAFAMSGKIGTLTPAGENFMQSDFYAVTELTIPASIQSIGYAAFSAYLDANPTNGTMSVLKKVTFQGAAALEDAVFAGCNDLEELVGSEKVTFQKNPAPYGASVGRFENTGFKKLTITPNLMYQNTFSGCKQLETVIIADGNSEVSSQLLTNCNALEKVYLPASVTKIGLSAFYANEKDLPALEVYYGGTEVQWNKVEGRSDRLQNATVHYRSSTANVK